MQNEKGKMQSQLRRFLAVVTDLPIILHIQVSYQATEVKNPPVEPVVLQPEWQFQRMHPHRGTLINPTKHELRNNDQNSKAPMTDTVACYCIGRKYLFGTFGHLTFEFVSNFDIRILKLSFLSTSKAGLYHQQSRWVLDIN